MTSERAVEAREGRPAYGPQWTSLRLPLVGISPDEHHRLYCEARPIQPQSPLESCPFRAWHDTQEVR